MREHRDTNTRYRVTGVLLLIGVLLMGSCSDFILDMEGKTVVFDSRGGSAIEDQVFFTEGSLLEEPADPIREGYCFAGWYRDQACSQAWDFSQHGAQRSLTLYAKWVEEVSVTFDSQGGSSVTEQTGITAGTCASEPADPTWEGYTFSGWFTDAACTDSWDFLIDEVTDDMTLYAGWQTALLQIVPNTVLSYNCFGKDIAIDGDHLIASSCDFSLKKGSVYSFTYTSGEWEQQQRLFSPGGVRNDDRFGISIDISGDYMIVGRNRDTTSTLGSVCFYHYNGTQWVLMETIYEPDTTSNNYFGRFVAIDGEYAVVEQPSMIISRRIPAVTETTREEPMCSIVTENPGLPMTQSSWTLVILRKVLCLDVISILTVIASSSVPREMMMMTAVSMSMSGKGVPGYSRHRNSQHSNDILVMSMDQVWP